MKTIYSIQHMRGIAALAVVGFHFRWILNNIYAQKDLGELLFFEGYFGVDLFFMISGFIIVYATKKNLSHNVIDFAIKRVFRLFPLFIVCFLVAAYLVPHYQNAPLSYFIKSILLIPVDFNQSGPGYGYNLLLVAWTLSYEVAFYFMFMIAMLISHKHRSTICSLFIILLTVSAQLWYNGNISFSGDVRLNAIERTSVINSLSFISNPMFLNFVVGIFFAEIFMSKVKLRKDLLIFFLSVSIAFFIFAYASRTFHGKGLSNIGLPCAVIFSAYVLYDKCNVVNKNTILNFLGDISYSLYLSHVIVIELFKKYQITHDLSWFAKQTGFSKLFFIVSICVIVAYILHISIEKPFVKLGRKFVKKLEKGQ